MQVQIGEIYTGKVTTITNFGAFVSLPEGQSGMVHISEVSSEYVKEIRDHLTEGQEVSVKVIGIDDKSRISLSMKKASEAPPAPPVNFEARPKRPGKAPKPEPGSFEAMMLSFKKESEEKLSAIKRQADSKRGIRRK